MKIGIIGAGNIGGALTRRFRAAGHDVTVANSRGPQTLTELARETGARAGTVEEAVAGRDVTVIAIPLKKVPELPAGLFADAPNGLIVIDTGNYYPQQRDGRIGSIEDGLTESGWVEQQIGHPVIKAFNSIYSAHLEGFGRPVGAANRIALPISGDDAKAKTVVTALIDGIGFDTVDSGPIADSWRQEPGSPASSKNHDIKELREALAQARHERTADWRAAPDSAEVLVASA